MIKLTDVVCGVGNVLQNKGGIGAYMRVDKTTFLFVAAHLAAHQAGSYLLLVFMVVAAAVGGGCCMTTVVVAGGGSYGAHGTTLSLVVCTVSESLFVRRYGSKK